MMSSPSNPGRTRTPGIDALSWLLSRSGLVSPDARPLLNLPNTQATCTFGDRYADYRRRTRMIIPFVL